MRTIHKPEALDSLRSPPDPHPVEFVHYLLRPPLFGTQKDLNMWPFDEPPPMMREEEESEFKNRSVIRGMLWYNSLNLKEMTERWKQM
jgi:hypothetical protein